MWWMSCVANRSAAAAVVGQFDVGICGLFVSSKSETVCTELETTNGKTSSKALCAIVVWNEIVTSRVLA